MEEDYFEVIQEIKVLKENYMLVRDSLKQPSEFFLDIAGKLADKLESVAKIREIIGSLPEGQRN